MRTPIDHAAPCLRKFVGSAGQAASVPGRERGLPQAPVGGPVEAVTATKPPVIPFGWRVSRHQCDHARKGMAMAPQA
jgi:hypothetical protein